MHRVFALLVLASACRDRPEPEPPAPVEPPPAEKPAEPRVIAKLESSATKLVVDGRWLYSIKWRFAYGGSDKLRRTSLDDGRSETVLEAPGMIGDYAVSGGVIFWTRERLIAEKPEPGAVMMRTDRETKLAAADDPRELELADGVVYYADGQKLYRWSQGKEPPRLLATAPTRISGLAVVSDRLYVAIHGDDDARGSIAVMPAAGGELRQLAAAVSPYLIAGSPHRIAWVADGKLTIADRDGEVVKERPVASVQALVVDGSRVFWIDNVEDKPDGQLMMIAEDGAERVVIANLVHAGGMVLAGEDLIWHSADQLWTLPKR